MKKFNRALGKLGEDNASDYLVKNGFKIIEKNYSTKFGEIDLIAVKNNILRFIEVKLKKGEDFGTPEEMIDKNKLFQVTRMSQFYLMAKPDVAKKYDRYSIDAICVVVNEDEELERIDVYENIGF